MTEQTDQQKIDRERALERIKKCLRLSKSSNPHEASAALRQAQKLMKAFSISDEEVMGIEITSAFLLTTEPPKKKYPMYLGAIVSLCCRAFGVEALFECGHNRSGRWQQGVRYFGPNGRPELAKYAHEVMWTQMKGAWNDHRSKLGFEAQLGERSSFWIGWVAAVNQKVMDFGGTKEEEEAISRSMTKHCDGEKPPPAQSKDINMDSRALRAGIEAAKDFQLHRPMEGSTAPAGYGQLALGCDE